MIWFDDEILTDPSQPIFDAEYWQSLDKVVGSLFVTTIVMFLASIFFKRLSKSFFVFELTFRKGLSNISRLW